MESLNAQQILDHAQTLRDEMVAFLRSLVLAESPSTVPASQHHVLRLLEAALHANDFCTHIVPGKTTGGHLYARPRVRTRAQPVQLMLGHCDTVWPLGTLRDMPASINHNVMRGPGSYDMKGGLTLIMFTLRTLRDLGLAPVVTPVIFINSDEEIGSRESTPYIERLARCADRAFILEPALGHAGKLKTRRKGGGRFTVRITGKSAHAGLAPETGASAILELSHVIQQLHALNDPERGISVNVGMIEGGLRPNIVAPESQAVIDVRVRTQEDAAQVEQAILALEASTPGTEIAIEGCIGRLPMEATPRNQALWEVAREAGEALGIQLEEGLSGGFSDGNTTSLWTATLDGLGAVGDGAHAKHEFLYLDKLVERCALLTLLVMQPPLNTLEYQASPHLQTQAL